MCRNIKPLYNFEPPATDDDMRAAALQFVRKVSGFNKPTSKNEVAFNTAVDAITVITKQLLDSLETTATPKNRDTESEKARLRNAKRFGK